MAERQKHRFASLVARFVLPGAAVRGRRELPELAMGACALFLWSILLSPALRAQDLQGQQQAPVSSIPQQPTAPLLPNGPIGSGQPSYIVPARGELGQTQPDTHALSGLESLTTGSIQTFTGILDPGISLSDFGYSGQAQGGTATLTSGATLGATLDAAKSWGHSNLAFTYKGSDTYYYPVAFYGPRNLPSDSVGLSLSTVHNRWTFRVRDDFLYSWQAGFGSLFTGGPVQGSQNSPLPQLQPSLNPTGTILTGFARQLNDLTSGEVDYSFSHRTTVTLAGSYGLLDFITPGYLSSRTFNGQVGYNYALSSKNTLGLLADYNRNIFSGTTTSFDTDRLQMSFGRKITGRLAFQIAAGPELTAFSNFGTPQSKQLSWSASGSVTRQTHHAGYALSYLRAVTAGSGVYFGTHANTLTGSVSRQLTESWTASVNGGYAASAALIPNGIFAGNFKNWFAGALLGKQIGRRFHAGLSYQYQRQIMSNGACPVVSCGVAPAYQALGVTVNWHPWSKGPQ